MTKWQNASWGDSEREELAAAIRESDRLIALQSDDWSGPAVDHQKPSPDPATRINRIVTDTAEILWLGTFHRPMKRMIIGVASSSQVNSHNYCLLARGCQLTVPIPLLFDHTGHAGSIGVVGYLKRTATLIRFKAVVHDHEAGDAAWAMIRRGALGGVSCAADQTSWHLQAMVNGVSYYDQWTPREISVVPRPACPGCFFRIMEF